MFLKAAMAAMGIYGGFGITDTSNKREYRPGKDGALFKDAHIRARELPKLPKFKRCKKTGYLIHG